MFMCSSFVFFFFFNDTATTEIYTLSLHDALPISILSEDGFIQQRWAECMSPIDLESALPGTVRRRELRDRRGPAVIKQRAKETAVDAVIFEVLVHTDEILRTIAEIGGVESFRIDHRRRAWQIVRCGGSARTREDIVCGF